MAPIYNLMSLVLPGMFERHWGRLIAIAMEPPYNSPAYAIGVAHTVGKEVVLITRSGDDVPSDIRHFEHISYVYDPEGADQLMDRLRAYNKSCLKP